MIKKFFGIFLVALICMLSGCESMTEEPCMYCGQSPSQEYEKSDGTLVYVCEVCSSECMLCHDKATKHYESLLGIMFVCNDCYNEVVN